MTIYRIRSLYLNTEELTLYKEDGESISLKQGDPRIKEIVNNSNIINAIRNNQIVEIELKNINTTYQDFEEKTNGLVKFFRVAKKFVSHIFNRSTDNNYVEPIEIKPSSISKNTVETSINDIMSNAVSVSSEKIRDDENDSTTIIAQVDGKIIPGMENLSSQFQFATQFGSPEGVTKFLQRIAAVIDQRGHSIDDLLRFMKRADLPISDDGHIIAYKALVRKGNHSDIYTDIHSRNVPQKVGTKVFMSPSMVDPNRRNECSNGLHIARRAYLSGFRGDAIFLCKIAPEDVIAVPNYDANKVRVCAYHILSILPSDCYETLYSNAPMTTHAEASKLLTAAIKGEHVGVLQTVEIGGHKGTNLKITDLVHETVAKEKTEEAEKKVSTLEGTSSVDTKKPSAPKVAPKDVKVSEPKNPKKVNTPTTKETAISFYNIAINQNEILGTRKVAAKNLIDLKKKNKISYSKWGLNTTTEALQEIIDLPENDPVKNTQTKTAKELARELFEQKKYSEISVLRKSKKISLIRLGFTEEESSLIEP